MTPFQISLHRRQITHIAPSRVPARLLRLLAVLPLAALLANVRLMGPNGEEMRRAPRERTEPAASTTSSSRDGPKPLPFPFPQDERGVYPLEFVHIPKTGGTSIEMAASNVGIAWGMCKFAERSSQAIQKRASKCKGIRSFRKQSVRIQIGKDWRCSGYGTSWHCPPWKYEGGNKFENVSTFAVVRDPYDRMISEYCYFHARRGEKKRKYRDLEGPERGRAGQGWHRGLLNDRAFMNRWIISAVEAAEAKGHCYLGHCVPFHRWVRSDDGEQAVTHVLRMENLTADFGALMDRYRLPIRLEEHHNKRGGDCTLGVEDLSAKTIAKINAWADLDFKQFGYKMLDPDAAPDGVTTSPKRRSLSSSPWEQSAGSSRWK